MARKSFLRSSVASRRMCAWRARDYEPLAQILHNLASGTRALPGSAFHKALELDRAMLARERDRPLARALVAAEVRVLPDTPAGVTAPKIGIARGIAQRGSAGI